MRGSPRLASLLHARRFVGKASTSDWTESPLVTRLGPTVLRVKMPRTSGTFYPNRAPGSESMIA